MIPTLTDYLTGTPIRPATREEWARSKHAAAHEPGGTGAFDLDGRTVFVDGDYPDLHVYTVYNPARGACLGSFPGADKAAALDAYARDAGYPDFRAACEVTGDDPDDDAGLVVRETSTMMTRRRKATQDYDDAHAAARAARDKIVLSALKTYHATTYAAYTAKQEALTLAYEARDKSGLGSDDPEFSVAHDAAHRDFDDAIARAQQTYAAINDAAVKECEAAIGAAYLVYREVVPEPRE